MTIPSQHASEGPLGAFSQDNTPSKLSVCKVQ